MKCSGRSIYGGALGFFCLVTAPQLQPLSQQDDFPPFDPNLPALPDPQLSEEVGSSQLLLFGDSQLSPLILGVAPHLPSLGLGDSQLSSLILGVAPQLLILGLGDSQLLSLILGVAPQLLSLGLGAPQLLLLGLEDSW